MFGLQLGRLGGVSQTSVDPLLQFTATLVASGVWDKLVALHLFAQPTSADAIKNLINPGTFDVVATNSPTFTADRGFTGDGVSAHLLGPTFTSLAAAGFSVNDMSAGVFSLSTATSVSIAIAGTDTASQAFGFHSADTARSAGMRSGTTTTDLVPAANSGVCHVAFSRSLSTKYSAFVDRMKTVVPTTSVSIPGAAKLTYLRAGTAYSTGQVAAGWIGKALTDAEYSAMDTALTRYLTRIGAYTVTRGNDGVWTWFNDPRVILVNGQPVIGAITSNGTPVVMRAV